MTHRPRQLPEDSVTDQTSPDNAIRDYARALLLQDLADHQARQKRISDTEAAGLRVVGGSQGARGADDKATWTITDWRTGNLLEHGIGEYDDYSKRMAEEGWVHIDSLYGDVEDVDAPGVPETLTGLLQDWISMTITPHEDVALLTGWSVEEVARLREAVHPPKDA